MEHNDEIGKLKVKVIKSNHSNQNLIHDLLIGIEKELIKITHRTARIEEKSEQNNQILSKVLKITTGILLFILSIHTPEAIEFCKSLLILQ